MSVFDLAVLGPGAETHAAAGALRLIAGHGRPAIVVSDAGAPGPLQALPATRSARRLSSSLDGWGARSTARGRLAFVRAEREVLVAAARRVTLTAGAVVVLALAQPRDEITDMLLAESADVVVLSEPGGALAALALWQLDELGVAARALSPEQHIGTALARFGWAAPLWVRRSPRGTR